MSDIVDRIISELTSGDWTPFVNNIEDILSEIKVVKEELIDLDNKISETQGMIKNLRKNLINFHLIANLLQL